MACYSVTHNSLRHFHPAQATSTVCSCLSESTSYTTVPRSLKPRLHQQHCRSNIVEYYKSNDSFDKVECCFDIVDVFGNSLAIFDNNIELSFVFSTKSKQIEHVQFVSTLSKRRNVTINSFDIVADFGNKVECCFDKVERCFDIVAGVDGALKATFNTFSVNIKSNGKFQVNTLLYALVLCVVPLNYYANIVRFCFDFHNVTTLAHITNTLRVYAWRV